MSGNKDAGMSQVSYKKMVDTMILLFNRGPEVGGIVKRIAKAGDVKEVMEYANRIHKLVVKYKPAAAVQPSRNGVQRRARGKRSRKGVAQGAGEESAS